MLHRDETPLPSRGYTPYPETWTYDPRTQTSDLIVVSGDSSPTTVSSCSGTTGVFGGDNDESNDDTGKD
jgi:hypothetical protein